MTSLPCPHGVHGVTNYSAEYLERWSPLSALCRNIRYPNKGFHAAQMLLAAGRGSARMPACEHTLLHVRITGGASLERCFRPLLGRALSLFLPGEIRALSVEDPVVLCDMRVTSATAAAAAPPEAARDRSTTGRTVSVPPGIFDSVCSVKWRMPSFTRKYLGDVSLAFAFVERHAEKLRELDCHMGRHWEAGDRALARCTRLESLTYANYYDPTVWLGLSHTLHGVDFGDAPVAAIAAALPRLRNLDAHMDEDENSVDAVRGFFDNLLPRLQIFHFYGSWPQGSRLAVAAATAPQPLPSLNRLVWESSSTDRALLRMFAMARPTALHTTYAMFAEFLAADQSHQSEHDQWRVALTAKRQ